MLFSEYYPAYFTATLPGCKLLLIHNNPVVAGLCRYLKEYRYSLKAFYEKGTCEWDFINTLQGLMHIVGEEHPTKAK